MYAAASTGSQSSCSNKAEECYGPSTIIFKDLF